MQGTDPRGAGAGALLVEGAGPLGGALPACSCSDLILVENEWTGKPLVCTDNFSVSAVAAQQTVGTLLSGPALGLPSWLPAWSQEASDPRGVSCNFQVIVWKGDPSGSRVKSAPWAALPHLQVERRR